MDYEAIALTLGATPPVEFHLDASNAFTLTALLQLALRHPQVSDNLAAIGREVVDGIRGHMPPEIQTLIDRGFDPAWDVKGA